MGEPKIIDLSKATRKTFDIGVAEGPKPKPPTQQFQPQPVRTASDVQRSFDNMISQAATGMDMNAIQVMMNARIAFEIKDRDTDEKEDVIEKRERIAESEEKEKKEFKEEIQEKEEVQQRLAEEIEKRMPENEGEVKERIDNVIEVFEGTGLVEIAEKVQESIAADRLEAVRESVEQIGETLSEKAEVIESIMERIKEGGKDGCGAGAISDSIAELSKQDKGDLQKELDELSKELKGLTKEDAIDRVKDFVNKHSGELNALKDIEKLLDNWDKLSPKEIKEGLKDISKKIQKTTETLEKSVEELKKLVSVPDEFIKKAKQLFSEDKETLDAIRRTWIGSVIDFVKEKLIQSDQKKDEKGKEFWKDSLGKIEKVKDKSIDDFSKRLAEILNGKPKELQEARSRADKAVIDHVESIADNLEKGRYVDRLKSLAELGDKKEIKPPLDRIADELRMVGRKAGALLEQARKGDLKGMLDELGKPTGDMGVCGRLVVRTVDRNRNRTKTELIRQLTAELYAPMATKSIADGMKAAQSKGDYELVDEMAANVSQNIGKLKGISAELSVLLRMRKSPQRRGVIASALASVLLRPKRRRKASKSR